MSAPTLLVGLGGTGSRIVQMVYNRATKKQRENISFVIFDTDVNELRVIEEKTPQIRTIQTSTRLTVGEYLDCDHYSRDHWFPVNRILNGKALTEGAGQVRAVSRLALNTAIQQGKMAPLNEAIEDLYKLNGQRTVQAPRVILVGSLCGGTGSGLILPTALYIRNFMTTKLQQSSAIIRGFFLLPEVFDSVIKTQSEKNNLRSNAYAAVREIDSFMMKDDGSLPEKYDLHFMAPRAGSKAQDEYTGRPMDYCFLFDAQNLNGMKLNSFVEYQEHAANCIYGMAIAPTSKRSNSSEDNVIREIIVEGGRNRFAGAGSSILIYPTDDIKRYLALNWTRECVTDEWLEVDHQFSDELQANRAKRKQGCDAEQLDRGAHYVDVIRQGYQERRPFASAIRNLCYQFDGNGFTETGVNWQEYIHEVDKYVMEGIASQKQNLKKMIAHIQALSSGGSEKTATAEDFSQWYNALLGYKSATIKYSASLVRNASYSLFKEAKDKTKTKDRFRVEYWLHENGDETTFIHPNAIRYFLYNAIAELKVKESKEKTAYQDIEKFWNNFERDTFDDKETEDHQETEQEFYENHDLMNSTNAVIRFLKRGIGEAQQTLRDQFSRLFTETEKYWNAYVKSEIYREAISYMSALCEAFHGFYDVLDRNISKIDREIEELEEKYVIKPGEARRYVCANKTCMRGLAEDIVNRGTSLDMPAEMNCAVFNRMKEYALSEQKPKMEKYFTETFNDTIVQFLESEIEKQYDSRVNMDIISALEQEAYYENPDDNYELEPRRLYARHVIESSEILAKPFIEAPVGKEPRELHSCAYHPSLAKADFPGREAFVNAYLSDNGGVEDESIDPNVILFYKAVYDIRANELSKFAPPRSAQTYEHPSGEYYRAYYELVSQIHPETQKSKVITPHIDRWWHIISKMPDLDEQSQQMQEEKISASFFWGMLAEYVHLERENEVRSVYHTDRSALNLTDDSADDHLIVSNGTPCDHLYEVFDAFTIYPKLVDLVYEKIMERVKKDLYMKVPLEKSVLFELLARFRIDEYDFKNEDGTPGIRSIFALPILMKKSVPAEKYYENNMIRLLETIFRELKAYIGRFCSKKELPTHYAALLKDQYQLFLNNIQADPCIGAGIYNDSLFVYISKAVAKELEDNFMHSDAMKVEEQLRSLRG